MTPEEVANSSQHVDAMRGSVEVRPSMFVFDDRDLLVPRFEPVDEVQSPLCEIVVDQQQRLKTLQLANHQGNWSILDESYESLPAVAEPVDVEIQRLVENWRRSWEEGNLPTYIACYHPQFRTDELDHHGWIRYKQDLFGQSAKRTVQISDVQVQANGSSAVVTFTQSYQTANHRDLGTKILHLRYNDDRWTILKENWQPLSGQG